jgi:hypothetical protein
VSAVELVGGPCDGAALDLGDVDEHEVRHTAGSPPHQTVTVELYRRSGSRTCPDGHTTHLFVHVPAVTS